MTTLTSGSKVVIYGAGKIGGRLFALCQDKGIEVIQVWDNFPERVVAFHRKELVSKPPDFSGAKTAAHYGLEGSTVIVTAFSPNMASLMAQPLMGKGFGSIIHDRSEISSILIDHCKWLSDENKFKFNLHDCFICPARRDEKVECSVFNAALGMPNHETSDYVSLPVLGFLLTTKCNLTCVGCNHLRDHFEKEHDVDFRADEILGDLRRLLNAVDFVKSLVVVGGEALVHPDFEHLLRQVINLPQIGFVQIITNGTVIPRSAAVFKLLAQPRVVVEISGYGSEPGHLLVNKRNEFFKKLSEFGVSYRYDEATQWIDFGGFHERGFTPEAWDRVYETCCFVSNDLFNGQLHKCSRSAYGLFLGKIPEYKGDFVDIRSTSAQELRGEIKKFIKRVPMVCRHCNGTTTKTIPAGVQVVKIARRTPRSKPSTELRVSLLNDTSEVPPVLRTPQ